MVRVYYEARSGGKTSDIPDILTMNPREPRGHRTKMDAWALFRQPRPLSMVLHAIDNAGCRLHALVRQPTLAAQWGDV